MSTYGKHWKIDGLISGPILEGRENGSYRILFEREHASLDQIEAVHWDHPSIQYPGFLRKGQNGKAVFGRRNGLSGPD